MILHEQEEDQGSARQPQGDDGSGRVVALLISALNVFLLAQTFGI